MSHIIPCELLHNEQVLYVHSNFLQWEGRFFHVVSCPRSSNCSAFHGCLVWSFSLTREPALTWSPHTSSSSFFQYSPGLLTHRWLLSVLGVYNLLKTFCVVLRDYGHLPQFQVLVLRWSAVKCLVGVVMIYFLTFCRAALFPCVLTSTLGP